MSFEKFDLLDNKPIDNPFTKTDYLKFYYHQQANVDDPVENVEFIIGENINYHQIGIAFLQFDISIRKDDNNNFNDEAISLVKIALANTLKEARLATTRDLI